MAMSMPVPSRPPACHAAAPVAVAPSEVVDGARRGAGATASTAGSELRAATSCPSPLTWTTWSSVPTTAPRAPGPRPPARRRRRGARRWRPAPASGRATTRSRLLGGAVSGSRRSERARPDERRRRARPRPSPHMIDATLALPPALTPCQRAGGYRTGWPAGGQAASGGRSPDGIRRDRAGAPLPTTGLVGDRRVETPSVQLALCGLGVLTELQEREGEAAGYSPSSWTEQARRWGIGPGRVGCWRASGRRASWMRVSGGSLRRTRRVVSSTWWAAPKRQHRSIDRRNGECRPDRAPRPSSVAVSARSSS